MQVHREVVTAKVLGAVFLAALLMASGCQNSARTGAAGPGTRPAGDASVSISDPCADRLHELSGALLLYVLSYQQLPPSLDALAAEGEVSEAELQCPVSHRAYAYNVAGLHLPGRSDRLIVYDATPVHAGHRWGIVMSDPQEPGPRTAEVVPVREEILREILAGRSQK